MQKVFADNFSRLEINNCRLHCVRSVRIRSFSSPYFPAFSPNAGKYGPKNKPNMGTFHAVLKSLR